MQEVEVQAGKVVYVGGFPIVPLYVSGKRPLRFKFLAPTAIEESEEFLRREAQKRIDRRKKRPKNRNS